MTISQTNQSFDQTDLLESFVLFMHSQSEFKDYNFDGSGLRELLRVLGYDSQQRAFQNNFVFNELASPSLRENAVTAAANLGYFSKGKTASKLKVNITVVPKDSPSALLPVTLKKTNQFFVNKDGEVLYFSPDQEYTAYLVDGKYTFANVVLLQGTWNYNSFLSSANDAVESFAIPNKDIDVDTLVVQVRQNETTDLSEIFTRFKSAYDLGSNNPVFFVRENRNGFFEVEFGDGKVAKNLTVGNVILFEYLVTSGANGNDVASLIPAGGIGGYFDVQIDIQDTRSYGGAEPESIESIKRSAPLSYAAQGSAVTADDYIPITEQIYPAAKSVVAWGGETNDPIKIGYTFVAVALTSGELLTDPEKLAIKEAVEKYNVGSIDVIVVDPEYTYLTVNGTVRYNPKQTLLSEQAFAIKVKDFLAKYSADKLEVFASFFDMSKLVQYINVIDPAVKGNNTSVTYEKRFVPQLNFSGTYIFKFGRSIAAGSVKITGFRITDPDTVNYEYYVYDVAGILKLVKRNTVTENIIAISDIGVVDYSTGTISLIKFRPNFILDEYVSVAAAPVGDASIQAGGKDILKIGNSTIGLVVSSA